MKRPMITIEECMSMSEKELNEFLDVDELLLAKGVINKGNYIEFVPKILGFANSQPQPYYGFFNGEIPHEKGVEERKKKT